MFIENALSDSLRTCCRTTGQGGVRVCPTRGKYPELNIHGCFQYWRWLDTKTNILGNILVLDYILTVYDTEVSMPQVSLYIDKETLVKIEHLARKNHVSISRWVGNTLRKLIKDEYPDDFFSLFGALTDASFSRPDQPAFSHDGTRETV